MDWNNRDEVLKKVKEDGAYLQYVSDRFKDDYDVVLEACKQDGRALQYASDRLRDDYEVVLEACKNCGCSLKFASDRFKEDKEIVMEACKDSGLSLKYASNIIKKDRDFLLKLIKLRAACYNYADISLKKDLNFIRDSLNTNINVSDFIDKDMFHRRDFLKMYVNEFNTNYAFNIFTSCGYPFLKECISYDNPIKFVNNFNIKDESYFEKIMYDATLECLENTNFSLDYRIDVLKKLNLKELKDFFKERYKNDDYDLGPLDNTIENTK